MAGFVCAGALRARVPCGRAVCGVPLRGGVHGLGARFSRASARARRGAACGLGACHEARVSARVVRCSDPQGPVLVDAHVHEPQACRHLAHGEVLARHLVHATVPCHPASIEAKHPVPSKRSPAERAAGVCGCGGLPCWLVLWDWPLAETRAWATTRHASKQTAPPPRTSASTPNQAACCCWPRTVHMPTLPFLSLVFRGARVAPRAGVPPADARASVSGPSSPLWLPSTSASLVCAFWAECSVRARAWASRASCCVADTLMVAGRGASGAACPLARSWLAANFWSTGPVVNT